MSYCPTHVHTCYSIRDGIIKIKDYAKRCSDLGLEAATVTEHGSMHSSYKFYKTCKDFKIKPIIGQECYYSPDLEDKDTIYHLVLIAKNKAGYDHLCMLSSLAYIDGFYKKPRISLDMLAKYSEGLICTTACVFGRAQQLFLNEKISESVQEIRTLRTIFGEDFYLEIANHQLPDEDKVRDFFRQVGSDYGIRLVAATDSHYLNPEDKEIHNIFKQIAYNSVGSDKDDSFPGTGYHIHSYEEMAVLFDKSDLESTLEIADKCNVSFNFTKYHLPSYIASDDADPFTSLDRLARKGMIAKGFNGDPKYEARYKYEMDQLHLTQLEDYFLIVADYIQWCREKGIPVGPGRGSAAGSLISYLIGITTVNPVEYDLLFSRAINPGRALQFDFGV